MKSLVQLAAIAALGSALALPAQAAYVQCPEQNGQSVNARLLGSTFGGNFGSQTGFGQSSLQWNPNGTATINVSTFGIPGVNDAGLYRGSDGSGDLVFDLSDDQNMFQNGMLNRTITLDEDIADEIRRNPSNFSIRVDSPQFPDGALRGQLGSNRFLGGALSGSNVVGGTMSNASGAFTSSIRNDAQGRAFLDYEFTAANAGSNLTGLGIYEGGMGAQGNLRLNLGQNLQLDNGRYRGSIELNDALLRDLMNQPQNFYLQGDSSSFPNGVFRGQFGWSQETFIPVFGSADGVGGSQWRTDLRVFNTSHSQTATVAVEWFPRGSSEMTAAELTTLTIEPRGSAFFSDSMAALLPGQTGIGAVRLTSNTPIAASARVYNMGAVADGTFGQAVPGLSRCAAMSRGVLPGLTNNDGTNSGFNARTNIGFFNPTGETVTVQLRMNNSTGTELATRTITLAPWAQMQMPLLANSGGVFDVSDNLRSGTLSFHANGDVYAYASVVDNVTGDATTLLPQIDLAVNDAN